MLVKDICVFYWIHKMIRLNQFSHHEIDHDVKIVEFIRTKQPNYLIKDVWSIVCLFLFGGTKHLIVSIPFASLVYGDNLFPSSNYISCFYGLEDKGFFHLIFNGQSISVSGRNQLNRSEFENGEPMKIKKYDLHKRAVLKLSFVAETVSVSQEKWFTWNWLHSKTFYSLEDVETYQQKHPGVPIFYTNCGRLQLFASGNILENTIRIRPTGEFQYHHYVNINL